MQIRLAPARAVAACIKLHTRQFHRQIKGKVSSYRPVPSHILAPPYAATGKVVAAYPKPSIHDTEEKRNKMRRACAAARDVLAFAIDSVKPGMTTDDIDKLVHEKCISMNVYPSPLNYSGFPKSVCTSINEVVCHGIPDVLAEINEGDVVKLDVSCYVDGVHGDNCRTVIAGDASKADPAAVKLVQVTKQCLDTAAAAMGPGVPLRRVGEIIEGIVKQHGYGIVRQFAGHGIGETFHTEPLVYHHRNDTNFILRPGMTFTIEPMICEGSPGLLIWPDGWTVITQDGSRAAQFEHTILITEHGAEILTAYE